MRPSGPLFVGGRSAGARVAARCAVEVGAAGVLAIAFPLHPPGRPERSRVAELQGAGLPVLVVQGERDPFGTPGEFPVGREGRTRLVVVPGADHSLRVPGKGPISQSQAFEVVVDASATWVEQLVGNRIR